MTKKKEEGTRVERSQIEEAWRDVHNVCAKLEGMLVLRDALAVSKDAYAELDTLAAEVSEHVQAAEKAAKKRRDVEGNLANLEQRLTEQTDHMRKRMVGELEQRNADLLAEGVTVKNATEQAKTAHKDLVQRQENETKQLSEELKRLNADKKNLERDNAHLRDTMRKLREGIPVAT